MRHCSLAILVLLSGAASAEEPLFSRDAKPILARRCFECHGPDEQNGKVNFAALTDDRTAARQRKLWRKAIAQLESGAMPPKDATPLADAEREQLLAWMRKAATTVDASDPANRDPGPAPARRLSLAEYNYTIRDLLGFPFDAAEVGMTEETSEGNPYGNLAAVLEIAPAQGEKYFAAADKILDRFFGVELSSTVDGRIQDQARAAREKMFTLKPNQWRNPQLDVKPPEGQSPRDAAKAIIAPFLRRAYRGPVGEAELERFLKLYDRAAEQNAGYVGSVRWMLKAALVSPRFLYRVPTSTVAETQAVKVGDHELASRLSYFLWSSMPDDGLLDLADAGKLGDAAVLEQQVKRMLADPKARALTDQFFLRWLQVNKLPTARPSTEFFPEFSGTIRQALHDEAVLFCDTLRTEDRSLVDLLDANYTFVNEELAKYYGLPEVKGKELRRVEVAPEAHRGGVLGLGSVLAITSHTSRTSPTLRGKWILEVLFGTPPPPPPANVSQIKEEPRRGKKEIQTFREKLAMHATEKSCAGCHRKMDPLGFALDNYSAVGLWREKAGDLPLDVTGELPTGEKLTGAADLKRVLLARKDDFARNLTEQMLLFALGRELDYYDDGPVLEIAGQLAKDDYRFSSLVLGIVRSYPFQYRRGS